MANPFRGETTLRAGGKDFTLVFNSNAMCALEQVLKMPFTQFGLRAAQGHFGFEEARAMLYVGMLKHHKSTTLERCGELMDEIGITETINLCMGAMKHVFPKAAEGNGEAASGTGSASSSPPVSVA